MARYPFDQLVDVERWDLSLKGMVQGWGARTVSDVSVQGICPQQWTTGNRRQQTITKRKQDECLVIGEATSIDSIEITTISPAPTKGVSARTALEERLHRLQSTPPQTFTYLTHDAYRMEDRQRLGLPLQKLESNDRLRQSKQHLLGMHASYCCLSPAESFVPMQKEDVRLQLMTIFWYGSPKIWLVVPPMESDKLEACVATCSDNQKTLCDQFERHKGLLIPPSVLDDWRVSYLNVMRVLAVLQGIFNGLLQPAKVCTL